DTDDDDTGVSVPWSPAETLYATAPASVRSDVYSLAATLWHLLVGRSPFEISGGDNSTFALMRRVRDVPPPSTGRPDVPTSLDRLLRTSMSKQAQMRPESALSFARALGEFGATITFAGNAPGVTRTAPLAIYVDAIDDPQRAIPMSIVLVLISLVVVVGVHSRRKAVGS
ncbi:MAG TPA: protein kinase, partial [Gordonia sp. (in: high G+C Gram-positive bacteria)]|nr:protein kinase [Gordonia sp. (in: high G+C Gram-positive bacteria)]